MYQGRCDAVYGEEMKRIRQMIGVQIVKRLSPVRLEGLAVLSDRLLRKLINFRGPAIVEQRSFFC